MQRPLHQPRLADFESTETKRLEDHTVHTSGGGVTADKIIIARDKMNPTISPPAKEIFHGRTFMSVSEPLTDKQLRLLFPDGKQMQCWDSQLVYSCFRLTGDNPLLSGGGSPLTIFFKRCLQ